MYVGVSASVSLSIIQPTGTLDVIKDQTFNVLVNVSCSDSDCNNVLAGLKIPNLETVTYDFIDTSVQDCFGGTCLARPNKGPPYNISGSSNWGCGKCASGPVWIGIDMRGLAPGCVVGMTAITGVNLCFEANNGERWDVIFSEWPAGGSGNLVYTRSIERGILRTSSATPFYINTGDNPLVLSLTAGSSQLLNFSIKATGNIGSYSNLVVFASDQESSIANINIKEDTVIPPQEESSDTSSKSSTHRRSYVDSGSISITEDSTNVENSETVSNKVSTLALTGSAVNSSGSSKFSGLFWWSLFGIIFIGLVGLLIFVAFKKRASYY